MAFPWLMNRGLLSTTGMILQVLKIKIIIPLFGGRGALGGGGGPLRFS